MEPNANPTQPVPKIPHHPSEDQLEKYALGRLTEPEIEKIETHLLVCSTCQDELTAIDQYVAAMKGALAERDVVKAAPAAPKSWMSWRPIPAFSFALATLSIAVVVSYNFYPAHGADPAGVVLRSVRGSEEIAEGPANHPLDLTIQSEQLKIDSAYRAEVVDARGAPIWNGSPENSGVLKIPKSLKAGSYWVRLRDANGNLLQEYGLHLK